MMLIHPIIGIVRNFKDNLWHPIVFEISPLPGGRDDAPVRHKSKMHHTTGFPTREAALANIKDELKAKVESVALGKTVGMCLDEDIQWDGEGIPTDVAFFVDKGNGIYTRAL
jgi:hypothetical protein